jgi:hypothetical protein
LSALAARTAGAASGDSANAALAVAVDFKNLRRDMPWRRTFIAFPFVDRLR